MQVEVVDNRSRKMASVLSSALGSAGDVRIAVAFVSRPGLKLVEGALSAALDAKAEIEFLVGLDLYVTEAAALRDLYDLARDHRLVSLYCYASLEPGAVYHPKLYLLKQAQEVTCLVGSSNLTAGGLRKNAEVNVCVSASVASEFISDAYAAYNRLKFHPRRVLPDEEFVALYEELCKRERARRGREKEEEASRSLREAIERKTQVLQRPRPAKKDLVGWLESVYDLLPEGTFTNQDAYAHEEELQQRYPQNNNVRAKIRQQLQFLAAMGFLEHVATGRWRKV